MYFKIAIKKDDKSRVESLLVELMVNHVTEVGVVMYQYTLHCLQSILYLIGQSMDDWNQETCEYTRNLYLNMCNVTVSIFFITQEWFLKTIF